MAVSEHLQTKLDLLPDSPGCYIMKDDKGEILYVGKAKVLKNRVRSYFHGVHNNKTTKLVSHIADFEFIVTGSEKEALLLEINLIKKHRPPYNIMFMDDKMYPYIEITGDEHFAVRIARKTTNKKSTYYGPYPSGTAAYEMVKLINRLFPIRKCRQIPKQPCLYYHMHQCLGPCFQEVSKEETAKIRRQVVRFLKGNTDEVLKELQEKMEQLCDDLQFERAQEVHEMITSIEHISQKQTIDFADRKSRDVFAWYEDKGYLSLQGLIIREGKMLERTFDMEAIYEDVGEAFTSFILQYYQNNTIPPEVLVPEGTDTKLLEEALSTKVLVPQRGEKKKLVEMAQKNAKEAHEQKFQYIYSRDRERDMAMQLLSRKLGKEIHTVEIFDNSHISGAYNVSGLVVFEDGKPDRSKYRHYQLEEYKSDLDSMKEVVYRRYFRLLKEQKPMPDLLLVDGGALQVQAAKEIKEMLHLDELLIAGLVKDDKHSTRGLINEQLEEVPLDKQSPLFFLLTRMQDEVHRFAIEYHRKLRSKGMTKSILDTIPGIGPARRKDLRKAFPSLKKLRAASLEELEAVVPKAPAALLYKRLHESQEGDVDEEYTA